MIVKQSILFVVFFTFFGSTTFSQSVSDDGVIVISEESKTLELIAIFNDAIDAPTKYNAYVNPYINDTTFPEKQNVSDTQLRNWINTNPTKIQLLLADRQKAHDELYGPRKTN